MEQYKNILTGINTFNKDWFMAIKALNKKNIIICDFSNREKITNILIEKKIDLILPLSDKDYLLIMDYIIDSNIKIIYPIKETIELLNNKLDFTKYMVENFKEYIPDVYYLNDVLMKDIEYPVISKPIYSTNGHNMKIYYDEKNFLQCGKKIIIQKFIEDEFEYGAYLLCISGKIINHKIIRFKYKKFHIKNSNFPVNYENIEFIDIELFGKIIEKLNYTGGMCVDFKFNTSTNNIYIFEMNPRFGGSAFSCNFIYELLCIK
jgi:carbamoylphosphate synthase large subunit